MNHGYIVYVVNSEWCLFYFNSQTDNYSAVQSQKTVSAYFTSTQILPSGFAEQNWYISLCHHNTTNSDINYKHFQETRGLYVFNIINHLLVA